MFRNHLELKVFCPVCAASREIEKQKPTVVGYLLQSLLFAGCSAIFSYLLIGWHASLWALGLTTPLSFLLLEFYDVRRSQRELICPVCDFDPVLYRRAPKLAEQRVLKRLERRKFWSDQQVKLRLSQLGDIG